MHYSCCSLYPYGNSGRRGDRPGMILSRWTMPQTADRRTDRPRYWAATTRHGRQHVVGRTRRHTVDRINTDWHRPMVASCTVVPPVPVSGAADWLTSDPHDPHVCCNYQQCFCHHQSGQDRTGNIILYTGFVRIQLAMT